MEQLQKYYIDGVFTAYRIPVTLPNLHHTIEIVPFGDIHRDSDNCDVERWHNFLAKCKKKHTPYTYYIGMGDYNDFASYSERKALRSVKLHEQTIMKFDELARKDIRQITNEISFMKGNLLGLLDGNHEWVFLDGTSATQEMCERLQCKYLAHLSYVRLSITFKDRGGMVALDLFVTHGKAGGKMLGTTVNQVDDLKTIAPFADIYIEGHDHRKVAVSSTVLDFKSLSNGLVAKQKRQWFARSGGFLKGYVQNKASYVSGRLLRPTDLGTIKFDCHFDRKGSSIIKDIHTWS